MGLVAKSTVANSVGMCMNAVQSVFLYSLHGFPLRLSALTEDTSMITVSSCSVKSSQAWKDRLKHWAYTCTFVAFPLPLRFSFHLECIIWGELGGGNYLVKHTFQ